MSKYKIYRFYQKENKQAKLIKSGLTLEQTQKHCQDPTTEKTGEWFDGYTDK